MKNQLNWLINEEIDKEEWIKLSHSSVSSSIFQHPDFYLFLKTNLISVWSLGMKRNDELVACVTAFIQGDKGIMSYFSCRAIIFGGPIYKSDEDGVAVMNKFSEVLPKKVIYIESRNLFDFTLLYPGLKPQWKLVPWKNFIVDTSNPENVFKNLSESRRRQIKKAIKKGVYYEISSNSKDLKELYEILQKLYQEKVKKPLLSFEFFASLTKEDWMKMIVVKLEGKVIGGIFCPVLKDRTIYEWYVCGLDEQYKDGYPSVMATWAAIEVGAQIGCKTFDFMGAGPSSEDYGVREFKARFGGTEEEPGRFLLICSHWRYRLGKTALGLLGLMKR